MLLTRSWHPESVLLLLSIIPRVELKGLQPAFPWQVFMYSGKFSTQGCGDLGTPPGTNCLVFPWLGQ